MPSELLKHHVRLAFGDVAELARQNLSGAAFVGRDLWVAGDETCMVERLLCAPAEKGLVFDEAEAFSLADFVDLPAAGDIEADIEGMDAANGYLWLIGSHGLKRKKPKHSHDCDDNLKRLATLKRDANRFMLARIPIETDQGRSALVKQTKDGRCAAILSCEDKGHSLTQLLADDAHLGPFLAIPGKDNGFDVEGIAVREDRVLLGLRGPVLRGWACLLEICPHEKNGALKLCEISDSGAKVRKHFIDLDGRGVRDLHWEGDDLYVLAGPTMVLDGDVHVYRWSGAAQQMQGVDADAKAMVWMEEGPQDVLLLPHAPGGDRAEAMTRIPPELVDGQRAWLVLYDAPCTARQPETGVVMADMLLD